MKESLSNILPYSSMVDEKTVMTKDGDLVRVWKLAGVPFQTIDEFDVNQLKKKLNIFYRNIGSSENVSVYIHTIRSPVSDSLISYFDNDFLRELDKKYYSSFNNYKMMQNQIFFTLIYRPAPSHIEKVGLRTMRNKGNVEEIKNNILRNIKILDDLSLQTEASLAAYGENPKTITPLTNFEANGEVFSPLLSFLYYLITFEWQNVIVPNAPLYEYLNTPVVIAGYETLEIRNVDSIKYIQSIDIKDYPNHTYVGMLDELLFLDFSFILCQSFSFLNKNKSIAEMERQRNNLVSSGDSVNLIETVEAGIEGVKSGDFNIGEYYLSMMVLSDSSVQCQKNRSLVSNKIQDMGFLVNTVDGNIAEAVYFANMPCNWKHRPRKALLTSLNFSSLASLHNFSMGKRNNNPWGDAVTMFKTPSGQPCYFNFHYAPINKDVYGDKLLGNTIVIGQSGSGKTVLLGFLLAQSQKYKFNEVYSDCFFDKDRGAEILIRAIGGKYFSIKNGINTNFNPLMIDDNEKNRIFLNKFIKLLVKDKNNNLSVSEENQISMAIDAVMKFPKNQRRLSIMLQNISEGTSLEERQNSIRKRLAKWCENNLDGRKGDLAWVFDNETDDLDFTTHKNYGFDGTDFLDNADIRSPISYYLIHRMEEILDGRRFVYYFDEAWKWIDDEAFSEFAGNKQLTIRKQNGLGVFATQMPSSFLNSKIASQLIQQCATEIYLPNPKADSAEYIKGFKLTEKEFTIIKNLAEDSHMFLVKQGFNSMIAHLDLNGFDKELLVLSGSTDNVGKMDIARKEVGDNPKDWLPVFYKLCGVYE